jgi:hypothetical protein
MLLAYPTDSADKVIKHPQKIPQNAAVLSPRHKLVVQAKLSPNTSSRGDGPSVEAYQILLCPFRPVVSCEADAPEALATGQCRV